MKPRKRDIEIFNMSVLDLLTGALGAFCFLTLALFPSYYAYLAHEHAVAKENAAQKIKKVHKETPKPALKQSRGMPPYAAGVLQVVAPRTLTLCGKLRISNYSGPGGQESMRYVRSFVTPDGFASENDLFMTAAGRYELYITASTQQPQGCVLALVLYANDGARSWTHNLTSSPAQYVFTLVVKPEDLGMPSVARQ